MPVNAGLELRKSVKPEIDAGETALLYNMEREIAQKYMLESEMLGALDVVIDIDDAYVRLESKVA